MANDLMLRVGNKTLSGWTSARVTVGIERMPRDFELSMTDRFFDEGQELLPLNAPTQLWIGNDRVISGYVERYRTNIGPESHSITVSGRGKCADLLDCSAEWPGSQIPASTTFSIAQKLCEPYGNSFNGGIKVTCIGDPGPVFPQTVLNQGETPYEIIERAARFSGQLVYEDGDGNLVLSGIGKEKAASGFKEGVNVVEASVERAVDQRYSEYQVLRMGMGVLSELGDAGNLIMTDEDKYIDRHRRRVIVTEQGDAGSEVAQRRAAWERARRFGRSTALRLTTDSWHDGKGFLYRPNTLVDLDLPSMDLTRQNWLISEVTYRFDQQGTQCDLVIMHPSAFYIEPVLLNPGLGDIPARIAPKG